MRAKLRPLIDFSFALGGKLYMRKLKAGIGRAELFAREAVSDSS